MSNKKQTSLEWLFDQIIHSDSKNWIDFYNKAKAMHKEEIMKAFNKGHNMDQNNIWANAEWYYISIFGGNNEQS